MRKKSFILVWLLIVSGGSWLLFVAQFSPHELLLGLGCALLTAYATASAWRRMGVRFFPSWQQLLAAWRLGWYLISGSWEMLAILFRSFAGIKKPGSFYRAAKFHQAPGSRGDAQGILATAYMTAAPNFIVIGADGERLLFHQIERSGVPRLITDLESSR